MKEKIEKIVQGDLEEARIKQLCEMIEKELEWLRRRLEGHAQDIGLQEIFVGMGYVHARIDDMEVYLK